MELLAPCGTMEKLKTAIYFGADAVYFAGKSFGLRAFAGNFSDDEMEIAVKYVHAHGKKAYITLNIYAKDADFLGLLDYAKFLVSIKVDAVIVADMGIIAYLREYVSELNIHCSTQANVLNSAYVNLLEKMGVTRVVLARELSLDEIKTLRNNINPKMELECFVHGAMCISYSGRCLLSNYLTGRDSNRGECVQACRWKYNIREISRENELEMQEDERGTYILNSKDLCMIEHLKELADAGVISFKIEGRMKSDYYVASVVNAYRRQLDGPAKNKDLIEELEKTSHRKYTTGFFFNSDEKENLDDSMPEQSSKYIANVLEDAKNGCVKVMMRNRFKVGEELEILSPDDNFLKTFKVESIQNEKGESIIDAKNVQEILFVKCPYQLKVGDILRT